MSNHFNWREPKVPDPKKVRDLSEAINVSETLATILVNRGIDSFEKARSFFNPELAELHDPFLMKGMESAVKRIIAALNSDETIMVYGDYDVDGTTAVSMVVKFLRTLTPKVEYYIPDRYKEGYGISKEGVYEAKELDSGLIIALDCGIRANEQAALIKELGMDLIICDHHLTGEELPQALAILNPKQETCSYPYEELSGCGIGFKLIQAIAITLDKNEDDYLSYLDLVMVSIAADIVPLTGENRIIAYWGLRKISEDPNLGLRTLLEISGLSEKGELSISNIVFGIAPRINAAGRMKHGLGAVELLLSEDLEEASALATEIHQQNQERREFDSSITQEAEEMLKKYETDYPYANVLYSPDWHQGVLGIVASRCIEMSYRPTIVLTKKGNMATGSARSIKGYDLFKGLSTCDEILEKWGGHKYAAGLSLKIEHITELRQRINKDVESHFGGKIPDPEIAIDAKLGFQEVDEKFYSIIKRMEPFGPGNMKPVLLTNDLQCKTPPRILKEKHLKVVLGKDEHQRKFNAIGFGLWKKIELVEEDSKFDMVYSLYENNFRGSSTLEMEIKDIKKSKNGTEG